MTQLGTPARPMRVAIVGSGPSGFYAAEALFKSGRAVRVDLFDRLPTPYGLVRGGVAPDHAKIKSVIKVYERIAAHESFAFLGNVMVGRDVAVDELRRFYDAILFTSGAETDRRLGVPGEDLPGSHTATEFVGWYNAHPDYRDRKFDLSCEAAAIIGQGNVAMDVSRILAKTVDELRETDIAAHALDALADSKVRTIYLIGRRGPAQCKFTPPEIKEIGELADCDPLVNPEDLVLNPESERELEHPDNGHNRKNVAVLREFAARKSGGKSRRYVVRFLESPVEIRGGGRVESLVLEKNRLAGEPGNQWAEGTGETVEVSCGLVFRSIGYRGVAIPGVPFDERKGIIPNRNGRVLAGDAEVPGLYVAGWIKRGPSGVIGTNRPCAVESAGLILEDLPALAPCAEPDTSVLVAQLRARGIRVVSFDDWRRLDALETERGRAAGKPREKFATVAEMLEALD